MKYAILAIGALLLSSCSNETTFSDSSISSILEETSGIPGKADYLASPYVTAGNRVYVVGHQDGTFPDLGWHVPNEMGGIWDHPIKLMDGFTMGISTGSRYFCLDKAVRFINYPAGNSMQFKLGDLMEVQRTQFVPDDLEGVIIEYQITNLQNKPMDIQLEFTGLVDLRPVWLSEQDHVINGPDQIEFLKTANTFLAKDSLNSWFTAFTSSLDLQKWSTNYWDCSFEHEGGNTLGTLMNEINMAANGTRIVRYFIAGSYESERDVFNTLTLLQAEPEQLVEEKISRLNAVEQTASIQTPDAQINEMYTWTKYTTDWLIREVPEIGRGLSAGIPDYPWWFGTDNTYSLQGLLATGQHNEVKATLELLLDLSARSGARGQIVHEASTNGVVFNPGNLNTTANFIHLLWKYYLWTGDKDFLKKNYGVVKDGITWLLTTSDLDQNGYPDGAGMMEIQGLHSEMIDVVVYTQAALEAASKMALLFNDEELSKTYSQQAANLKTGINKDWWVEEAGSYADFRASRSQAVRLIKAAIVRADTLHKPWAKVELENTLKQIAKKRDNRVQGHVVHHNWVVNTPMELGIADPDKADIALETAAKYTNPFGMYVTGIDRDENQGNANKWKSFSYVGAVMTLPTGVQAIAEARYGHSDQSLSYLKKLAQSFSYALPGSMYEVSPDYGMIAQAWNTYAVSVPIIEYFFGFKPNAPEKKVVISPQMPSTWDTYSIQQVVVGKNRISMSKSGDTLWFNQTLPDWTIAFQPEDSLIQYQNKNRDKNGYILLTGLTNQLIPMK